MDEGPGARPDCPAAGAEPANTKRVLCQGKTPSISIVRLFAEKEAKRNDLGSGEYFPRRPSRGIREAPSSAGFDGRRTRNALGSMASSLP